MNGAPQANSCPAIATPALARALGTARPSSQSSRQSVGQSGRGKANTKLQAELAAVTDANLPDRIGALVLHARAAAPGVKQAELVNGLTAAYCSTVRADTALTANERAVRLGQFSQLAYMAAAGHAPR